MKLTDKQKETLGVVGTGLTSGLGLAATNAQIKDTSGEEALINNIQNTQFGSGSFDNLLQSFDSSALAKTNYTKEDLRGLSTGEMWRNTLLGTATGALSGAVKGGWVGAAIEGGANLLGGIGGMIASNSRASKKAEELNAEATIANQTYVNNFNNAVQNTQSKMFNNSLLNMAAYGGDLNLSGGFNNGTTFINEGGSHESNPLGGVPMGVDQEGTPNLVEEGEVVFNDYVFSRRLKPTKKQLTSLGYSDKYVGLPFSEIAKKFQESSELLPTDRIALDSVNDRMNHLMAMQEEVRMKRRKKENVFADGGNFNILSGLNNTSSLTGMPYEKTLRYTSPLIHAGTLLSNLKKPDYSSADKLERKASTIPGGSFTPLGDYISLDRFDPNYMTNEMLATATASRRAIQNQGVNAGQAINALLANNYSTNKGIAEGLLQGKKLNNEIATQEAAFNRGTNQTNAQMGLQALAMDQQKANTELNALMNANQIRNSLDAMRSQAISNSLTGLGTDIVNIGREIEDRGMLNKMIDRGVFNNLGACGGKIKRRKK